MRKLLPALLSFMLFTLLLGSCGKHSYENSSILILAVGRNICTAENGES